MSDKKTPAKDAAMLDAFEAAGGMTVVADACGITVQAVWGWTRVPPTRVLDVEAVSGIPRERLRPDLYGAPRPRPRRPTINAAA